MEPRKKHIRVERTRHGKVAYYFRVDRGPRRRLPDEFGTPEFWHAYETAMADFRPQDRPRKLRHSFDRMQKGAVGISLKNMLRASRTRAREAGQPFDLDMDWAIATIEAQEFKCALTNIPFFSKHDAACRVNPFGPSFDRINPKGGYVRSNVRVVCYAINVMLMDWGTDIFETVINHYRSYKGTKNKLIFPALNGGAGNCGKKQTITNGYECETGQWCGRE